MLVHIIHRSIDVDLWNRQDIVQGMRQCVLDLLVAVPCEDEHNARLPALPVEGQCSGCTCRIAYVCHRSSVLKRGTHAMGNGDDGDVISKGE